MENDVIKIGLVEQVVCGPYRILPEDLMLATRKRKIVEPRQICMWMRKKHSKASLDKIGAIYRSQKKPKGMDHATVLHAIKTVNNLRGSDRNYASRLDGIEKKYLELNNHSGGWIKLAAMLDELLLRAELLGHQFDGIDNPNGFAPKFGALHYEITSATGLLLEGVNGRIDGEG